VRLIATLLMTLLLVAACGPAGAGPASTTKKTGGTLTIATSTDVLSLDLPNFKSGQDLQVGDLIYDTLVGYDKDLKLQPRLAESWKQVDVTTYRFVLRRGVKFQDGTPADASAVKMSFDRARTGQRQSGYFEAIDSISTEGPDVVVFRLKRPFAPFVQMLPLQAGAVQSPTAAEKYGAELLRHPVGTGPYRLESWVAGERVTLERNPDYWGPAPALDRIVFQYIGDAGARMASLEAGEVDVVQNIPPQRAADLRMSRTLQLVVGPYAQTIWLGFTQSHPLLSDPRVRQAIGMAIDRRQIVESVTEGMTRHATSFIPPEIMASNATLPKQDIAKAKQLLAAAGYPNGFQIELWTPNGRYLRDREIAEALQAQLRPIGVDARVRVLEYAGFVAGLGRHEGGLFVLGWAHTGSPDAMMRAVFYSKSAVNWSAYRNPDIDALLDKATAQVSFKDAIPVWQQADQALIDDGAGVPIYWSNNLYAAKLGVHGFALDSLGNLNIADTWKE
jgi:peptide/nickel transport system substrate-binding protein